MKTITMFYKLILSLRYKVNVQGAELLKSTSPKLFLPNHQAHVDAQILTTQIFKYNGFIPMVSARLLEIPVIKWVFKKLKAVPVGNMQSKNIEVNGLDKIIDNAIKILNSGNNVLIYPSGQLTGQGFEKIFNKSGAYEIAKKIPEHTQIIGIHVSGLWGSMWSKAWNGEIPDLLKTFGKGLMYILANLIFFIPKRKVNIEFINITDLAFAATKKGKQVFNNTLEEFYNKYGEEEANYIKHIFYLPNTKRQLPEKISGSLKEFESTNDIDITNIPEDTLLKVKEIIATEIREEANWVTPDTKLTLDLQVDSIGLVFLVSAIEKEFGSTFNGDFSNLKTVGDLCMIAVGASMEEQNLKPSTLKSFNTNIERISVDPTKNILQHFISTCKKDKNATLAYDKMMGTNTRKELLLKAIVVSKLIKKHSNEKYVGIMLPALESTTLLIMATYFAGKIPVMLNWTVGKRMLLSSMNSVGLKKVITASSFYDKIQDQLPVDFQNNCIFFDKEIKKATITNQLLSLLQSYLPRIFYSGKNIDETAVILFTSGSEANPKAVPLTHKNIMYNLWGVLDKLEIYNNDIILGFLPPFHSFGFTVLSILPVVSGIKVAYTPDPKDSREIAKILRHSQASIILATPTFLRIIMSSATDDDFRTVRLAISGAESLHPTIAEQFKKKTGGIAQILQGYGITECSPILTVTSHNTKDLRSVGKFISGVDYLIVDVNNNTPLKRGQEGMIAVRGNSIFKGYLDKNIPSPFLENEGKHYYKTGDLGYIRNGNLYITGRLKRFIKKAGEMISLPAIENALLKKYGSLDEQVLAIDGEEQNGKTKIILYTKKSISKDEVNVFLKKQGFTNLMKIDKVEYIDNIPLLGTGKIDYKKLKECLKKNQFDSITI